jgi:hypothetical protein
MTPEDFEALPGRIFLDSSTVQTLRTYGEFIWENQFSDDDDRIFNIPDGIENLESLRYIFMVAGRVDFGFAISDRSLIEAAAHVDDPGLLMWAYDVLDHWLVCEEESGGAREESVKRAELLNDSMFGYLGAGDRQLISDAVRLGCDAFLTMERKLPKNARHIQQTVGIRVMTPKQFWELLKPWAPLWI